MKIKDIMVTDVTYVNPNESIANVAEIIFSNRFHGLPVVQGTKVVGIVTEDDFFLKNYNDLFLPAYISFIESKKTIANLPNDIQEKIEILIGANISNIMTKEVISVSPEMNTLELMKIIKKTKFTTFPVVDKENNLVGIVTLSDILGTVKKGSSEMKRSLLKEKSQTKFNRVLSELNYFWKDKIVIISRKRIHTFRGFLFLILIEAAIILYLVKIYVGRLCF